MTTALSVSRDLVARDAAVVELSNSSESQPNENPVGPNILDLKYVSVSQTRVGDVQRLNIGPYVHRELD